MDSQLITDAIISFAPILFLIGIIGIIALVIVLIIKYRKK